MLRDGIKALVKWGCCNETLWPYNIDDFTRKPPNRCYQAAKKRCIVSYHRLATLNEMKICLASGFPFVFGFAVYESFESSMIAKTGKVSMPGKNERMLGGHAVLAVGYNEREKRFLVRNSWGMNWGLSGYFTMPYEYLESRNLSDDFWVVMK
jgi:C1A family cysteine protease